MGVGVGGRKGPSTSHTSGRIAGKIGSSSEVRTGQLQATRRGRPPNWRIYGAVSGSREAAADAGDSPTSGCRKVNDPV